MGGDFYNPTRITGVWLSFGAESVGKDKKRLKKNEEKPTAGRHRMETRKQAWVEISGFPLRKQSNQPKEKPREWETMSVNYSSGRGLMSEHINN